MGIRINGQTGISNKAELAGTNINEVDWKVL